MIEYPRPRRPTTTAKSSATILAFLGRCFHCGAEEMIERRPRNNGH
jgi:hypothetical protein